MNKSHPECEKYRILMEQDNESDYEYIMIELLVEYPLEAAALDTC